MSGKAVDALVANHRRFLSFLERRVGNRADAEEILQAAFVRGLERAGDIRDGERAVPRFYQLLRNALVDHWRRRALEERAAEICRCFEALLPTLKPEYADILRRVDLEGARPSDVAAKEGITPNLGSCRAGVRFERLLRLPLGKRRRG